VSGGKGDLLLGDLDEQTEGFVYGFIGREKFGYVWG
jgi:hypothetical protein